MFHYSELSEKFNIFQVKIFLYLSFLARFSKIT